MAETNSAEPLLTLDEGYLAAYQFIRQAYERDGRKPESMFHLLSWMQLEAPRISNDPAQWYDWVGSVTKAIELGARAAFSEPLSQPLTD